jgi:hypothetical protein
MTLREFLLMDIELSTKGQGMDTCTNCLKGTRDKIKEFFTYADCYS